MEIVNKKSNNNNNIFMNLECSIVTSYTISLIHKKKIMKSEI